MNTYYSFTELPNIDPVSQQILSFKFLPNGWHYGEGRGAEQTTVDAALRAYRAFQQRGITRIEVFPDVDGGILLSGYYEDETIEILCGPKGSVHVLYERDDEIVYDEDCISVDEATAYLRELPWNLIRISSDYFTLDISVGKKTDSRVWLSMLPQQTEAFRQWMLDAPKNSATLNADISDHITALTFPGNLLYSGNFDQENFQIVLDSARNHREPVTLAISTFVDSRRDSAEKL